MEQYVALDVSLKEISVCIVDSKGAVVFEGKTATEPATLIALIRRKAPRVVRVGLETGSTSPWLFHVLTSAGLPVVCMDARHAHAALSMRPTKSDRSDARGLADMLRMGWYREVHAKSVASHEHRTMLGARHQLVTMRSELDAQIRGMLKTFGLILGTGNKDTLIRRAEELAAGHPVMRSLVAKLAEVRRHVASQITAIDRDIRRFVRSEPTLKRLMTVPGVGPITALAFLSSVDDPSRFKHARDVARKIAIILHCIWTDGTEFWWTREKTA